MLSYCDKDGVGLVPSGIYRLDSNVKVYSYDGGGTGNSVTIMAGETLTCLSEEMLLPGCTDVIKFARPGRTEVVYILAQDSIRCTRVVDLFDDEI